MHHMLYNLTTGTSMVYTCRSADTSADGITTIGIGQWSQEEEACLKVLSHDDVDVIVKG